MTKSGIRFGITHAGQRDRWDPLLVMLIDTDRLGSVSKDDPYRSKKLIQEQDVSLGLVSIRDASGGPMTHQCGPTGSVRLLTCVDGESFGVPASNGQMNSQYAPTSCSRDSIER